jgi:hypothetical protein
MKLSNHNFFDATMVVKPSGLLCPDLGQRDAALSPDDALALDGMRVANDGGLGAFRMRDQGTLDFGGAEPVSLAPILGTM